MATTMRPWKKCLLFLTALFLYLSLGAFVFVKIEKGPATKSQQEFFGQLAAFVQSHHACGVSPDELLSFMDQVNVASSQVAFNVDMADHEKGVRTVWSWPNSIRFASSVVTTIGYGRLTPRTLSGQIFCTFYAVTGIPLCYVMLSVVGDTFNALWEKFVRGSDKCFSAIKSKKGRRVLMGAVTLTLLWLLLALLPSVIFTMTEPSWSWWRAQYFCFVSLSTIGFGDVVYGLEKEGDSDILNWGYKMGILVYLFLGLSLISIVFKGVWHSQRKNIHQARDTFWRKRGRMRRNYDMGSGPSESTAGDSFLADSSSVGQLSQEPNEVIGSLYDVIYDVGVTDGLRRDQDRSAVIAVSYRLTVPGCTAASECDSGRGSSSEINSRL